MHVFIERFNTRVENVLPLNRVVYSQHGVCYLEVAPAKCSDNC